MEKRVAIVGAGISGLLACKYTASIGLKPVVFEAEDNIGGLWNHTIASTRLQTVKDAFQFSDFPWPSSIQDMFPHNTQLLEYLQAYAREFELLQYVKFHSKVINIDYVGESEEEMRCWELWGGAGKAFGSKGKWVLNVLDTKKESMKEYIAEFVVICVGTFSGLPNIPKFPPGFGPENFAGKAMHIMEYANMDNASAAELIKGKRVAIIGSGKSAIDLAFECANANGNDKPCTVIQRSVHWMFPDLHIWGVSFGSLYLSRHSELMVHKPGEDFLYSLLATLLTPLRWGTAKFVESYLRWKLPLKKYDMIPKENVAKKVSACQVMFIPENFYNKVEDGSIILKKSQKFSFCKEGLIIDGQDDPIKADVVIFATGYKGNEKLKNMFASPTFQKYISGSDPSSSIPLYRQMIHPRIPQLAMIGYAESVSHVYTTEVRCKWLAFFLDQAFLLGSIKAMEKEVEVWEKYMKSYSNNGKFGIGCIAGVQIWFNDQPCRDMGINPRRKKGFFSEMFEPYGSADYSGITP